MLVTMKKAGEFGQGRRKVQGAVNFDDIGINRNPRTPQRVKLRYERRLGEMLAGMKKAGEISKGNPLKVGTPRQLKDLNISRDMSSRAQRIASIPEDKVGLKTNGVTAYQGTRKDRRHLNLRSHPITCLSGLTNKNFLIFKLDPYVGSQI